MGPLQAQALRKALAMGQNNAVIVSDRTMAGADILATSYTLWRTLATVNEKDPFDYLPPGRWRSIAKQDRCLPASRRTFNIPIISNVTKIVDVDLNNKTITTKHRFDDGIETVKANFPRRIDYD